MQPQKLGKTLFLALAFLSACRSSQPPKIEICILDGHGGGDCVEADGLKKYRPPSEMLNYWSTNQADEANYSGWCYDTSPAEVKAAMAEIEKTARNP